MRYLLYSRRDCHLCHALESMLQTLKREFDFEFRTVDVDSDADMKHRYGARVPVLVCEGRELVEAGADIAELRRLLGEAATAGGGP